MAIQYGASAPDNFMFGDTQVDKLMLGMEEIWAAGRGIVKLPGFLKLRMVSGPQSGKKTIEYSYDGGPIFKSTTVEDDGWAEYGIILDQDFIGVSDLYIGVYNNGSTANKQYNFIRKLDGTIPLSVNFAGGAGTISYLDVYQGINAGVPQKFEVRVRYNGGRIYYKFYLDDILTYDYDNGGDSNSEYEIFWSNIGISGVDGLTIISNTIISPDAELNWKADKDKIYLKGTLETVEKSIIYDIYANTVFPT